ncbi:MAG: glycosyltransferase family 39 protein, partial [Deltaproteobacteria bacterium]|nr:glycosyltransferase family 39 protein [Deltaproteobacteria bacterium]
YFPSSQLIAEWSRALLSSFFKGDTSHVLSQKIVDDYWLWDPLHNVHPPFYKILSSITWASFKNRIGDFAAYRLAPALMFACLIMVLFSTIKEKYGILAGVYGSLCLLFMPRIFGHAHIGATETPLMTLWFLSYWAYWKGLSQRRGSLMLAFFWGLALATKFTALLIPLPLLLWTVLYREKRSMRNILLLFLAGPLIAIAVNPGWWHDPLDKILSFVTTSMSRDDTIPIKTYYFGTTYSFSPHWSYAPVMAAITIPAATLFSFFTGLVALLTHKNNRPYNLLFFLTIPVMLSIIMLPGSPTHDGVRQFISIFPFVAFFAGIGLSMLSTWINARMLPALRKPTTAVIFGLLILLPVNQTAGIHPYELSYYNEIAGGLRGAHKLGMETTYWFEVFDSPFLKKLNQHLPPNASVSIWPPMDPHLHFLQEEGRIRRDLRIGTPAIKAAVTKKTVRMSFD